MVRWYDLLRPTVVFSERGHTGHTTLSQKGLATTSQLAIWLVFGLFFDHHQCTTTYTLLLLLSCYTFSDLITVAQFNIHN